MASGEQIPKCKVYVTMTDKFMSGWGRAEGKINKLVICADNWDEAETVAINARDRKEMKNINITSRKPHYGKGYYVSVGARRNYATWFRKNRPFRRKR